MSDSCMIQKLEHYIELTKSEKDDLAELEKSPRSYSEGSTVVAEGDDAGTLYVVQEGWLMSSNDLADGSRQILMLHYPGDILGTSSIAFDEAATSVTAGGKAKLCRFPKHALGVIYRRHPRLAALFYSIGMLENVALSDRLKVLGSSGGKGRVAGFIMEILSRLRTVEGDNTSQFEIKLTQADIGDAVGLTKIHVNRVLAELERQDRAIARNGREISILDESYLREISSFTDRYKTIDTSWFPPSE